MYYMPKDSSYILTWYHYYRTINKNMWELYAKWHTNITYNVVLLEAIEMFM